MPPIRLTATSGALSGVGNTNIQNPALPSGDYGYLFDADNTALLPWDATPGFTGLRMRANTATGLYDGTAVYTIQPTWGDTVTVSGLVTGDSATPTQRAANLAAVQSALDAAAASAVVPTRIVVASNTRCRGQLVLPPNVANVWIGIVPSSESSLPPLSPPTTTGLTRPTKANRLQPSHDALCWRIAPVNVNEAPVAVATGQVRKYWIRGLLLDNSANVAQTFLYYGEPQIANFGQVETFTTNTATLTDLGYTNQPFTTGNRWAWVMEGAGAGTIRKCVSWNTTTRVLTIEGTWGVTLNTTSVIKAIEGAQPTVYGGTVTVADDILPTDVFFMQCGGIGLGTSAGATVKTALFSGIRTAWCDGYTRGMGVTGQDSQDIGFGSGRGPHKYTNNESYVLGPKETWISGGRPLLGDNGDWLPRGFEIRYNKCRDIPGMGGSRKTTIEVKYGEEGLIECNDMSDQAANIFGGEITIKLTGQESFLNLNYVRTQHWTVRLNNVKDAGGLLQLSSSEGSTVPLRGPNVVQNIVVIGNAQRNAEKVDAGMKIGERLRDIHISHNSVVGGTANAEFAVVFQWANANDEGTTTGPNIRFRHNIGMNANPLRPTWVFGVLTPAQIEAGLGGGTSDISGNMVNVAPGATGYGDQITVGTAVSSLGFVNLATGDVRLSPSSPGYQAVGGKDVGAPVALIDALMADVI